MDLTPKQQEKLVRYLDMAKYENDSYTFGPLPRKEAQELYEILNILKAGYDASYIDKSVVNDDKTPILVYVRFSQATKVLTAASQITGKSLSDLTGGSYSIVKKEEYPTITLVESAEILTKKRGRPKSEKKEKSLEGFNIDFDFSDMLKQ